MGEQWLGFCVVVLLAATGAGIGLAIYDALTALRAPVPMKAELD